MEAPSIQLGSPSRRIADRSVLRLARVLSALLIAGLIMAAVLLAVRRIAGGLREPLPPIALAATGGIAAILAVGARRLAGESSHEADDHRLGMIVRWLPALAITALATAVSLPGSSPLGVALLWMAIVAEEVIVWWQLRSSRSAAAFRKERRGSPESPPLPDSHDVEPLRPTASPFAGPPSSSDVVQQLLRTRSAAGIDRIQGWLKTTLEPSERNAIVHVAFCPPFDELPKLTVLQVSGPASRIKPVQLLPYGVRLELKRLQAGHDKADILLEFSAEAFLSARNPQTSDSALSCPLPADPRP